MTCYIVTCHNVNNSYFLSFKMRSDYCNANQRSRLMTVLQGGNDHLINVCAILLSNRYVLHTGGKVPKF
jgi:hypothetical protein